jgi:hypothetical protein
MMAEISKVESQIWIVQMMKKKRKSNKSQRVKMTNPSPKIRTKISNPQTPMKQKQMKKSQKL